VRTLITVLVVNLLGLAPWVAAGELGRAGELPQIIAFDGNEFTGDHTHLVGDIRRLGKWDNSISSLIIVSGTWEFFDEDEFTGTKMSLYPRVTEKGL
jgi:Beta/Gamma crystallin